MVTIMKIRLGPPATGSDFYPRPALRKKLLRALGRGHVAFVGPRRTGKTSILEDIRRDPPDQTRVVLLDLEKLDNVKDWLLAMTQKTREVLGLHHSEGRLASAARIAVEQLKRIEKLEAMGGGIQLSANVSNPDAWRPCAEELASFIATSGERIYYLLDEFPWFLSHIAKKHTDEEVEALLNWFRGVRQEMADTSVRFLLTGSIGLEGFLRRIGLSPAANDLDTIEIPPLTDVEADELLQRLAAGENVSLSAANRRYILDLLGAYWPILLELFVAEIQDAAFIKTPTKADLSRIYDQELVRGSRNKYCQEMFTRIGKKEVFSMGQRNLAQAILRELTRKTDISARDIESLHQGLIPSESVRETMESDIGYVTDTLRHDGFVVQHDGGRITFASNILRDYWRHRVG